jgi:prepilin-type N-terminal cleavage/methylation domain-containing protein
MNKYLPSNIKRVNAKGFTLIELLVVIGILAILLAITLVALNPRQNFQQANDTQRQSDVNAILNAINQYAAQNNGQLPAGVDTTERTITDDALVTDRVDLCAALVPNYVADLPVDPLTGTRSAATSCAAGEDYNTFYTVIATSSANGNRVTVTAPDAEVQTSISVTR